MDAKEKLEQLEQKLLVSSVMEKIVGDMALALRDMEEGTYSFTAGGSYEQFIDSILEETNLVSRYGELTPEGEKIYQGLKRAGFYDAQEAHARKLVKR